MSTSPPAQHNPTSVFHALGSYADRIKSPQNVPNPLIPNGNPLVTSRVISPSTAAGPAKTPSRSERPAESQDDGPWETVGRHRPREERRTGGTTQNWRDRPIKETNAEDSGRKPPEAKGGKKGTSSSAPRLPASEKVPATRAPVTPSAGIKTAWGVVTTSAALALRQEPQSTPSSTSSTSLQTPKTGITLQSQTEPSSPSHNSNTATNTSVSIASPNLSVETASSSTAPTSVALRGNDGEEEGSRSSKPKDQVDESVDTPVPKPAPPPAMNAWDVRKKTLPPTASSDERQAEAEPAPVLQFGTVTTPIDATVATAAARMTNGDDGVKIAKNKKAASASASTLVTTPDANVWPDVAQAADKVAEERKEKVKEKKESEESSVVDDGGVNGRKPKWTPIPAAELLAAADEAAEADRRQVAARRRATKAESSESPNKPKLRKGSADARRTVRPSRSGSGEIRMPPMPQSQRFISEDFKPIFGTVRAESESGSSAIVGATEGSSEMANGGINVPLSRQTSRQSRRDSPRHARTNLPSPNGQNGTVESTSSMRFGTGPYSVRPMTGNATAPIPQNPFTPNHNFPRPPRGSFSGRGRGAYRNSVSNPIANGGNIYQRGYGMGYQHFYPPAPGYAPPPMGLYDPMQNQYMHTQMYGRGAPPPPPMPQTVVPNLDPLRFYVLGQVEYYFSMQNLAMDFFLRQQMDSQGWIDIAMISSFNRVKSLTPDNTIVREVMTLSSLLEVRDEKVRLANGESKRWVLPDAKPSTLSPDQTVEEALGLPNNVGIGEGEQTAQLQHPKFGPGDVENALMKSVSVPASSSASMMNGDESMEKTDTPATSMSDGKEEEEVR